MQKIDLIELVKHTCSQYEKTLGIAIGDKDPTVNLEECRVSINTYTPSSYSKENIGWKTATLEIQIKIDI